MAYENGSMIAETALPAVVRELLSFLGTGSLVAPDDARRIWNVSNPTSAADAIEAIVEVGGITASQGAMVRKNFVAAQREHLARLLHAATQRGLVAAEDAERVWSAFESVALEQTPNACLRWSDLLTVAQIETLRPADAGTTRPQVAVPVVPPRSNVPSTAANPRPLGALTSQPLGMPNGVAIAIVGLAAVLGAAVMQAFVASADFTYWDVRAFFDTKVTVAFIAVPLLTYVLAGHLDLPKQLGFAACTYALANVGLGNVAIVLALVGMRWLDGRPETRTKELGICVGLGLGLVALTWVVVEVTAWSVSSAVLERALRGRGDEMVLFVIMTLPKSVLMGAAGLAAAWCVRGGQRFATPEDLVAHIARAKWTWPLLGWAVGSVVTGLLATATDERVTFKAFCATVVVAGAAVAFGLTRIVSTSTATGKAA